MKLRFETKKKKTKNAIQKATEKIYVVINVN